MIDSQTVDGTPPTDGSKKAAAKNQTNQIAYKIFRASKEEHIKVSV